MFYQQHVCRIVVSSTFMMRVIAYHLTSTTMILSVLVLKGNGADVAKHAVPAVPTRRISITFRKMDPLKVPLGFVEDKELQGLCPAVLPSPRPGKENC
jgi:hypothetical protein